MPLCSCIHVHASAGAKSPPTLPRSSPLLVRSTQDITVVVNTFKRLQLLQQFVSHFSECEAVARIHVNWAESDEPPDLSDFAANLLKRGGALTFALPQLTHNDSSLNTRFLPVPGMLASLSNV